MALSEEWERRLGAAYVFGSEAFLAFTKSGNMLGLLQPNTLGDSSVAGWNRLNAKEGHRRISDKSLPLSLSGDYLGTTLLDLLNTAELVSKALDKLGLTSDSLSKLMDWLRKQTRNEPTLRLPKGMNICGLDGKSLFPLDKEELIQTYSHMIKFVGKDSAHKIMKLADNEDRMLLLSFLDIGLTSRDLMGAKNAPFSQIARSGQISWRHENRRSSKMSSINKFNVLDYSQAQFSTWNAWGINYPLLGRLFKEVTDTVADASRMQELMAKVAEAVNAPEQAVQTVIHLECGWPDSVLRAKSGYRSSMTREDGSTRYRGVSQASTGFWADVRQRLASKGITVPSTPERASLVMQIAAPFVSLDRYRNVTYKGHRLTEWPLTPGLVYSFHQQSLGGLATRFQQIAGAQSGASVQVVKATAGMYRQAAQTGFF